jgi:thiamine-phosphate pyrophosphorylase
VRPPAPPLLLVTDRRQARAPLEEVLDAALAAGCRWVSLREKDLPAADQIALARSLHAVARRHGAKLTLHGAAELARAAAVDGAHLPAGSDAAAARGMLGAEALIGISVHTTKEAAAALPEDVDYAVAGPAFETASKPGYGPALGSAGIDAMVGAARVPVIAIGGIEPSNLGQMLGAGAAGVAVMGGVMRADDVGGAVRALLAALQAAQAGCASP